LQSMATTAASSWLGKFPLSPPPIPTWWETLLHVQLSNKSLN
jgi:hypothetical protein